MTALLLADTKQLVVPHGMKANQYDKLLQGQRGGDAGAAASSSSASAKASGHRGLAMTPVNEGDDKDSSKKPLPKKSSYVPTGRPKGRPRKHPIQGEASEADAVPSVSQRRPPQISRGRAGDAAADDIAENTTSVVNVNVATSPVTSSSAERFAKRPRLSEETEPLDEDVTAHFEHSAAAAGRTAKTTLGPGRKLPVQMDVADMEVLLMEAEAVVESWKRDRSTIDHTIFEL